MTASPAFPRSSASSAVSTIAPQAAPGEALTPSPIDSGADFTSSWGSSSWRIWSGSTRFASESSSLTRPSSTSSTAMRAMACALRFPLRVCSM